MENTFRWALLISLLAHGAIFFAGLSLPINTKSNKPPPQMQYVGRRSLRQELPSLPTQMKNNSQKMVLDLRQSDEKTALSPSRNRLKDIQLSKTGSLPVAVKPPHKIVLPQTTLGDEKKRVILPQFNLDKVDNPAYINYYQTIREKIKRFAYQNYNRDDTGQIKLSFTILRSGQLGQVAILLEESSPNNYLRQIAVKSIKEASPFPPFPKELDYPQLSFGVVISFETEQ